MKKKIEVIFIYDNKMNRIIEIEIVIYNIWHNSNCYI